MTLTLTAISLDRVEFELEDGRAVVVLVGVDRRSWHRAVRFPHLITESGVSLGDDALDAEVRRRAAEELVRLDAAIKALRTVAA